MRDHKTVSISYKRKIVYTQFVRWAIRANVVDFCALAKLQLGKHLQMHKHKHIYTHVRRTVCCVCHFNLNYNWCFDTRISNFYRHKHIKHTICAAFIPIPCHFSTSYSHSSITLFVGHFIRHTCLFTQTVNSIMY